MNITEDQSFRADLLQKIAQREFQERTGVHCSDLIYCLNKQALRRFKPLPIDDATLLLFSLGWATQRWLTGESEDEPETEVDGIIVTLDATTREPKGSLTPGHAFLCPWELKATFQSNTRPIEENIHWIRQIMAQCYVVDSRAAYLTRLEIMGDWKSIFKPKGFKDWSDEEQEKFQTEHRKPTLSAYRLEFTREELDRNWGWLRDRRLLFLQVLDTQKLLPKVIAIPSGQEWECGWCGYKGGDCNEG